MKKIMLLALLLFPVFTQAQEMKAVFVNMPDSLCPLLTKNNRADFADFLESKMRAEVKNKFDKPSEMKVLTKDYTLVEVSSASTLQLKLLPVNDSVRIICMVNTMSGPANDSEIRFYTTDWKELPLEDYLAMPIAESFFITSDKINSDKLAAARGVADMTLIKAVLASDTPTLSFTYTTVDYMDKEAAQDIRPYLKKEPLLYKWENGRFVEK